MAVNRDRADSIRTEVDSVRMDVDSAIHGSDLNKIFKLVPDLALLPDYEVRGIETSIQAAFPEFRKTDLRKSIKAYRAANLITPAATVDPKNWRSRLLTTELGNPKALLSNVAIALRHAPEWSGKLVYNSFSTHVEFMGETPWGETIKQWEDHHDTKVAEWMQHAGIMVSHTIAGKAAYMVAREKPYHPVLNYLRECYKGWDGKERVKSWLFDHIGARPTEDTSERYISEVGMRWMVSAVARIKEPGCQADCCLILEGPQGIGKSSALRALAGEWFTDEIAALGSKDSSMQAQGAWVIELSELTSMRRTDNDTVKEFLSRRKDRFRPPFGQHVVDYPRQCVIAGSVNHRRYLQDETGGRRFWPVRCGRITVGTLEQERDQLWGEAVHLYQAGELWHLGEDIVHEQVAQAKMRYSGDAWDNIIAQYLHKHDGEFIEIGDVLHFLEVPIRQWDAKVRNNAQRSIMTAGWVETEEARDGRRVNGFRSKEDLFVRQGGLPL